MAWLFVATVAPLLNYTYAGSNTVTLHPSDDAYIRANQASFNYGSGDTIYISKTTSGYENYGLIRFNLSSIPSGSVIISAKLRLYAESVSYAVETLYIYRVTESWNEDSVTWDTKPSWDSTPSANITDITSTGWYEADVTEDIQAFVDGVYLNYGWILIPEGGDYDTVSVASKENSDSSIRPQLIVEYVEPVTVTETVYITTTTENVTITETTTITNIITETVTTNTCLLYTSPSPRDLSTSRMPSSA